MVDHNESCRLGDELFKQALDTQMKVSMHKRSHNCKPTCATRIRLGEAADKAWEAFREETGEE